MKKNWVLIVVVCGVLILAGFLLSKLPKGLSIGKRAASVPVQKLLDEAESGLAQNDLLKAKEAYSQILSEHPDYDDIEEIQTKLGAINMDIIFSKLETPQTEVYQVQPGDSLGKLAKRYNTTKELIQKSNGLKSDVIRVGAKLRIWKAPFNVMVSKAQNISILRSGDEVIKIYRVSTGKDNNENRTPVGTFTIANKIMNPVWFKPNGQPIPPESPDNELGTRWMGFAEDTHYGLHGTIRPEDIGNSATAGCVRLENKDVEELYGLLPVGAKVVIQE